MNRHRLRRRSQTEELEDEREFFTMRVVEAVSDAKSFSGMRN